MTLYELPKQHEQQLRLRREARLAEADLVTVRPPERI